MPKRKRVSWSQEEEEWIDRWLDGYVSSPHFNLKNINWKLCLKDLLASEHTRSIFPVEHQDATKIMECMKRVAKRESKSLGTYVKEKLSAKQQQIF